MYKSWKQNLKWYLKALHIKEQTLTFLSADEEGKP